MSCPSVPTLAPRPAAHVAAGRPAARPGVAQATRLLALAATLAVIASLVLGTGVGAVQAIAGVPKAVFIVGPSSLSGDNIAEARAGVAAARAAGAQAVLVATPNATWKAVRDALQGASFVAYLGHGNGFPNPHRAVMDPEGNNGFGLNASAGDTSVRYYGEAWFLREVSLAPHAVVLLSHVCYAGGSTEPGYAAPTLAVARVRVDNFAAGFLAAGAGAVLADASNGAAAWYASRVLSGSSATVESIWRGAPMAQSRWLEFDSDRTPGASLLMNPMSHDPYYYRAMTGDRTLTSAKVVASGGSVTDILPSALAIPGEATVARGGADAFPDATLDAGGTMTATSTLPAGTAVQLLDEAAPTADGRRVIHLGDAATGTPIGYVDAARLLPADVTKPRVWGFDGGSGAFSPNDDGVLDTFPVHARFSEPVDWTLTIRDAGGQRVGATETGTGSVAYLGWRGRSGGTPLPDGHYTLTITGRDPMGNRSDSQDLDAVIDTTPPARPGVTADVDWFTPDGDGQRDTVAFTVDPAERGAAVVRIVRGDGRTVRTLSKATDGTPVTIAWDGRNESLATVQPGDYTTVITTRDRAGNTSRERSLPVQVATVLGDPTVSRPVFLPDGDGLADTVDLGVTLGMASTIDWTIVDRDGAVVRTLLAAADEPKGVLTMTWDGLDDGGSPVPPGIYRSVIVAAGGRSKVSAAVTITPWVVQLSDRTPARGQTITITLTAGEPLGTTPVLTAQPTGATAPRVVDVARVAPGVFRATYRVPAKAGVGPLVLVVTATDSAGGALEATRSVPVH
ncbi:MAG: FlgD immunoglobulin-like domain containing protein [Chloroflexota bacterium]